MNPCLRDRLDDLLTHQAQRRPEATAIVSREGSITYGALDRASNQLARALRQAGCRRGDRVALLLPKSVRPITAMFAALKAGCIYVPIDTASPAARIERILNVCECRILLADHGAASLLHSLEAFFPEARPQIGWMDSEPAPDSPFPAAFDWTDVQSLPPEAAPDPGTSGSDPAHILFTSGSTGMPKGVVITHSNVIRFVRWAVQYFGMNETDRNSGHPPLHFDLSTFDIYGTIASGAQLHLPPPDVGLLPHRLADFIRSSELTQWFSAPSALLPLAKFDAVRQDDFASLRRLLWCGEKFALPALIYWMRRLPHVAFVNLYGPTEATIASSYHRVRSVPASETEEIPIGAPCEGETLLVLDDQLRPAPAGIIGDLYIGGVGLSPGYWKDPEKTRQVFIEYGDSHPHSRIYKTGDLARRGADGLLYLIGRSDSQVKVRGHRIELGEIETALHAVPGILDAAVVAIEGEDLEGPAICCAYVAASDTEMPPIVLKKKLAEVVPRYMIPVRWKVLDRMPHNANGKTDRVVLKQWFRAGELPPQPPPRPLEQDTAASAAHTLEPFGD